MQIVLIEPRDRFGVVQRELLVGDVVDPRAHDLANELAARLAAERLGDNSDRILGSMKQSGIAAPWGAGEEMTGRL